MSPTPYDDLLSYPYRGITSHPPMPLADRAAQFSPFAALTGYDNVIQEAARYTDEPVELAEDEQLLLNEKLRLLAHSLSQHPVITVTFFRADEQKEGGHILTVTESVEKVVCDTHCLIYPMEPTFHFPACWRLRELFLKKLPTSTNK